VIILLMSSLVFATSNADASGHAPVHMPNVVGLTKAQVYATMRSAQLFFRTQGPGSAHANWVTVVAETPTAGTLVPWRSTVTLTTSLHAVHVERRVPRLIGLTKARVYAVMKAAQLFFRTVGPGSSNGKWVAVARQSPAEGTLVAWHATVTITTRLSVPHPKRRVPRLLGLSRARALALMKADQLILRAGGAGASTGTWTKVLRQSPAPGTLVVWHAVVNVAVTKTPTRPVATTTTTNPTTTTSTTPTSTTTTYPGETTTSTSSTTTTTTTHPTTTTTRPVTTTTRKPSKSRDFRVGVATWYSYIPGRCATWFLPYGTRVTVRDLATGRAIVCRVTDKEAARGDRVVDLSETQFAQLAPLSKGVIRVRVSW
jgi:beta-lactam-binding protein with PASTA domain